MSTSARGCRKRVRTGRVLAAGGMTVLLAGGAMAGTAAWPALAQAAPSSGGTAASGQIVPEAPSPVTAIAGDTQVEVFWSASGNASAAGVTGYLVSAQGGGTTITETVVALVSSGSSGAGAGKASRAVIGGLTNGTPYQISVAAITAGKTGPATTFGSLVTPTAAAPLITSANSVTAEVGRKVTFKVTAAGKPKPTLAALDLPSWLTLTPAANGGAATVTGTPPAGSGGTYPLVFMASNGIGFTADQDATLTVDGFTSAAAVTFSPDQPNSFTVTTTPTTATIAVSGSLPRGVYFSGGSNGTATLSGMPASKAKSYSVTFEATAGTEVFTQKFTLTIASGWSPIGNGPS